MSQVAQFRETQAAEEQAAQNGLSGSAAVASHETIIARMEQGADPVLMLFKQGRNAEAEKLWMESKAI